MGHRSVITANIFFILRITLCDFYLWKSVIHTTHRFRLIFIAFFACAKRGRTQNTAKKRKTEINIFRSTDMHQKRASTTYCIQAQPHILSQTQMPRRVYIFNTLAHSLALSLPLSCSLNNHNTHSLHNKWIFVQTGSAWICALALGAETEWMCMRSPNLKTKYQ